MGVFLNCFLVVWEFKCSIAVGFVFLLMISIRVSKGGNQTAKPDPINRFISFSSHLPWFNHAIYYYSGIGIILYWKLYSLVAFFLIWHHSSHVLENWWVSLVCLKRAPQSTQLGTLAPKTYFFFWWETMLDLGLVNKNRLRRNFIMFFFCGFGNVAILPSPLTWLPESH